MTQEEYKIYMQGAKDFARLMEKDLVKREHIMPNNTQLKYVYTNTISLAIQNSLLTLDVQNTLNSNLKSELKTETDFLDCADRSSYPTL